MVKLISDMTISQLKRANIVLDGRLAKYENIALVRKLTNDEIEFIDNMKLQKINVIKGLSK